MRQAPAPHTALAQGAQVPVRGGVLWAAEPLEVTTRLGEPLGQGQEGLGSWRRGEAGWVSLQHRLSHQDRGRVEAGAS